MSCGTAAVSNGSASIATIARARPQARPFQAAIIDPPPRIRTLCAAPAAGASNSRRTPLWLVPTMPREYWMHLRLSSRKFDAHAATCVRIAAPRLHVRLDAMDGGYDVRLFCRVSTEQSHRAMRPLLAPSDRVCGSASSGDIRVSPARSETSGSQRRPAGVSGASRAAGAMRTLIAKRDSRALAGEARDTVVCGGRLLHVASGR